MTMRVRTGLMLVVAVVTMGLASCDHYVCSSGATFGSSSCAAGPTTIGGGGGATGTVFAYLLSEVGASDGMTADTLNLGTNSFAEASPFTAPSLPSTVVPDGGTVVVNAKFVYVVFNNGTVYGYAIDGTTGALTNVPNVPYTGLGAGTSITADPAGHFLFVSDSTTGDIYAFTINADGSLTSVGLPFASSILAAQLATDGLGKYLYATEGPNGAHVAVFAITPVTGVLTAVTGNPFSISVAKLLGENTGKYMFGIDGVSSVIHVFSIAQTGIISDVASSPFATAAVPIDIVVHPNGNFVYAVDGLGLPMEGYALSASTGTLTAVAGSPFTGVNVDVAEFDQSGLFMFGVSEGNVAAEFGPYATNTSSGVVSPATFEPGGFPGGSYAVTDLSSAP